MPPRPNSADQPVAAGAHTWHDTVPDELRVQEGEYVKQVVGWNQMHIPWYHQPPDDPDSGVGTNGKKRSLEVCYGSRPDTIFGPIKEVRDNWETPDIGFISVLVPTVKDAGRLHKKARCSQYDLDCMQEMVWINIGKNTDTKIYTKPWNQSPRHAVWCRRLTEEEEEKWCRRQ